MPDFICLGGLRIDGGGCDRRGRRLLRGFCRVGLQRTGDPITAACWGVISASFVIEGFGALHALESAAEGERSFRLRQIQERMTTDQGR